MRAFTRCINSARTARSDLKHPPSLLVTVDEPNHGRSTSDTVRFRDASNVANLPAATINVAGGYTITKVNDNKYTFNSGVTASVTLEGGGDIASAGPVTVTA